MAASTTTYGVANHRDSSDVPARGSAEHTALLGGADRDGGPAKAHDGHATMLSSVSNLTNTIIGSGMLTFPLALASAGILPGVLTCIFSGSIASFGLYLLSLAAARAPPRRASWSTLSQLTYPRAAVFFDAAIAAKCFGVSISYLIIIKRLMPSVVEALYHDLSSFDPPGWALSEHNWVLIFLVILTPLAFLRRLDNLRYTSYVSLFSVVYLVVIVITCYFYPLEGTPEKGEVHLIHFTPNFISTFPVQVFAFTCAQNLLPIHNELASNTQSRLNLVIGASIGGATLTYEVIAVFGYLTFGSSVGANIIAMYPSTTLFIAVGQLAIVVLVLSSYPLQIQPCRNSLDKVFHPVVLPPSHTSHSHDDDDDSSDHEEDGEVDDGHGGGGASTEMPFPRHALLTALLVLSTFTIAYFVSDLQMVLAFVGATGSTTISFILPGLFYWKLTRGDPGNRRMNGAALGLVGYGVAVMVFCLTFNIVKLARGEEGASH